MLSSAWTALIEVEPAFSIETNNVGGVEAPSLPPLAVIEFVIVAVFPIGETWETILVSSIEYAKSPVLLDVAEIGKSGSPNIFVTSGK